MLTIREVAEAAVEAAARQAIVVLAHTTLVVAAPEGPRAANIRALVPVARADTPAIAAAGVESKPLE